MAFPLKSAWASGGGPRSWLVCSTALGLALLLILAAPAQARNSNEEEQKHRGQAPAPRQEQRHEAVQPKGGGHPVLHSDPASPRPPRGGAVVKRLPPEHLTLHRGKEEFYYHHGHYFRHYGDGFVVVEPPMGLVVPILPPGYTTVVVAGNPYFYYQGTYYTRDSGGFVVVTPPDSPVLPPPPVAVPASPYGAVTVTAPTLNVRSGPGRQFSVITVIQQGDTFPVQANAPGWVYVQLPNGQFGWVEQRYTTPAASAPAG